MRYRPDIDGLRAIAVSSVVVYHADHDWLPGGFTGVDVFFVISGYLITKLIAEDFAAGRFTLARFYERRARRILPALFTVLFAAFLAAYAWLLPADLERFGQSVVATSLFVSNILFWQQTGYFDAPPDAAPLLHTWSLAVEEQFYLLFPLVLLLLLRRSSRVLAVVIWGGLLASLALAEWGVRHQPNATFYLGPTRAWELMCGVVLALGLVPAIRNAAVASGLAAVGLASILLGFLVLCEDSRFPGLAALLPCLGTALVIHSGEQVRTPIATLLSLRPVVFVGLVSYSLYLWHWVIFVFARHIAMRELTMAELIGLITLSLSVAVLTWRFVEQPLRRAVVPSNSGARSPVAGAARAHAPRPALLAAAAGSAGFLALGATLHATSGVPARLTPQALAFANAERDVWSRRERCDGVLCMLHETQADRPGILIWGDSHAASLAPAFEALAEAHDQRAVLAYKNSCAPLIGYRDHGRDETDCHEFVATVLRFASEQRITRIVLHARWAWYVEGSRLENVTAPHIVLSAEGKDHRDNPIAFRLLLASTLAELRARGFEVFLISAVPEVGVAAPEWLARQALRGAALPRIERDLYDRRQAQVEAALAELSIGAPAQVVHLHPWLCDAQGCALAQNGRSLYHDDDHLSVHGALHLRTALEPLLGLRTVTASAAAPDRLTPTPAPSPATAQARR